MTEEQLGAILLHWSVWITFVSGLLVWLIYPFNKAWYQYKIRRGYDNAVGKSWWHYLTYGRLLEALVFGAIPVINWFVAFDCLVTLFGHCVDRLENKQIFKEKKKYETDKAR